MKRALIYFVMLSSAAGLAIETTTGSTIESQADLAVDAPNLAFVDEDGNPAATDPNGDPVTSAEIGNPPATDGAATPTTGSDGGPIIPTDSQPVTPQTGPTASLPGSNGPGITIPPPSPTTTDAGGTSPTSTPSATSPSTPTTAGPTTGPTTGSPTTAAPTTGGTPTTAAPTTGAPTTAAPVAAPTTAPAPNGPSGGGNFPQAQTALISGNQGSQPGYLQPQAEPHGGTTTRITNTHPTVTRNIYSSSQAFNADESVIFLAKGGVFVDVASGSILSWQSPGGFSHWSTVDPEIMLSASGSSVRLWNARTGSAAKTIALPGYTNAGFQVRTNPAVTGDKVGVKAQGSDGSWYGLAVNTTTGNIDSAVRFDDYGFSLGGLPEDKARRATASPSGQYLVLSGFAGEYQKSFVLDWNTGALVYETRDNNGVECPGGHGDMALDAAGKDVFVGICKGGGAAWSNPYRGQTVVMDLANGAITPLPNVPGISHYSGRNLARPGWAYGSSYGGNGSIVAFKLDGSRVEYYADPQNTGAIDYWAQTQAVPSPSGRRIVYATAWHNTNAKGNTFLLDLTALGS